MVVWLDNENQVRASDGGKPGNLSRFEGGRPVRRHPRRHRDDVVGEVFMDRYSLWYTASGGTTNKRRLVWNVLFQKWEAIDRYADHDVAFVSKWVDTGGVRKLLTIGSDRTTRLCDLRRRRWTEPTRRSRWRCSRGASAQPIPSAHPLRWTRPVQRNLLEGDDDACRPEGGGVDGDKNVPAEQRHHRGETITTTAGSNYNWAYETIDQTASTDNAFGIAGTVNISATTTGARIYRISIDETLTAGGPNSA